MNAKAELNHIATLDLDPIKAKLMEKDGEGWTQQRVDAMEREYRRFLCVAKLYPQEEIAPLMDVDIFWHYHILDTLKYAADCQRIFGYFLHHSPQSGPRSEADEASHEVMGARMQQLYRATFGEASNIEEKGHAAQAWSPSVGTETAYCQVGMTTASARRTGTAYCQVGVAASQTETAYCQAGVATASPRWTDTAYCQVGVAASAASQTETAYCQVGVATASPRWTDTAYCQVGVAASAASRTETAYCQVGVAAASLRQTDTAYCQVGVATRASFQPEIAYCQVAATSERGQLPEAKSAGCAAPVAQSAWRKAISSTSAALGQVAAWRPSTAQNSSVYSSRQVFAQAA